VIIRLPTPVLVADPLHGEAVLTKPGGPVGSCIDLILQHGKRLQKTWLVQLLQGDNWSSPDSWSSKRHHRQIHLTTMKQAGYRE
jgi:hypothetical protein